MVPIIYGDVGYDPWVERGAAVLGGCVVDTDSPTFICKKCGAKGNELSRRRSKWSGNLYLDSFVIEDND